MAIHVFLLLQLMLPPEAGAGFWERCQSLFSRANAPALPLNERALWAKSFPGTHPYLPAANNDSDFFYFAFGKLPGPVRGKLATLPSDAKLANIQLREWIPEPFPSSFLDQVLNRLRVQKEGNRLGAELAAFEAKLLREPTLKEKLELRFKDSFQSAESQARWIRGDAGESQFPVLEKGGKSFLVVGEKEIEFKALDEGFLLFVPRENMANAAWNPVSREKLGEMAAAGVKPPEEYHAGLGHNGLFYPDDANHRLHLDAREVIPVRMRSLKTLSLRLQFDYLGLPQPPLEKIRAYTEGKISWEELLPSPEHKRHFLLAPGNALP